MTLKPQPIVCTDASIEDLKRIFYRDCPLYELQTVIAGIHTIATHYGPHNDEIASAFILQTTPQGKYLFPGIEKACIGPISATKLREHGFDGEEGFFKALQKRILLIGVGHGPLDEHGDRETRVSCIQQIVELLDLGANKEDRIVYGSLIQYVNFEDRKSDDTILILNRIRETSGTERLTKEESHGLLCLKPGGLAQNLKKGFEVANGDEKKQAKVFQMAYSFYENEIEQARMFQKCTQEYDTIAKKGLEIKVADTKVPFVLLHMRSDNPLMNKVVRSKWRANRDKKLGVLFIEKTNGQFVILPNQQYISGEQMREVVKILRQMVALNTEGRERIPFSDLGKDEIIPSVPEIHYDRTTGVISNGSKVDPDAPGLIGEILSIEDIIKAIQIGLDTGYFPSKFALNCAKGNCAKGACSLYQYGQDRCHKVRNSHIGTVGVVLQKVVEKNSA